MALQRKSAYFKETSMKLLNARKEVTLFTISVILFALMQACGDDGPTGPDYSNAPPPFDTTEADKVSKPNGLTIYIIEEGNGVFEVEVIDQITVYYTGRKKDGTIFASSYDNQGSDFATFPNLTPIDIVSPQGIVSPLIEGFRLGLLGMVENEKRTIVIPPGLGYGESREGTRTYDLRNDTLIYDVELAGIFY